MRHAHSPNASLPRRLKFPRAEICARINMLQSSPLASPTAPTHVAQVDWPPTAPRHKSEAPSMKPKPHTLNAKGKKEQFTVSLSLSLSLSPSLPPSLPPSVPLCLYICTIYVCTWAVRKPVLVIRINEN